jgi:hypothetical protein
MIEVTFILLVWQPFDTATAAFIVALTVAQYL